MPLNNMNSTKILQMALRRREQQDSYQAETRCFELHSERSEKIIPKALNTISRTTKNNVEMLFDSAFYLGHGVLWVAWGMYEAWSLSLTDSTLVIHSPRCCRDLCP